MTKKISKNPNSNNYFNKPEENCSSRGRGKTWRCCPNQQDKLKKHKNPETAWTNKEWIFHHEINSDELHKPKIPPGEKVSLLTVEQLRTKYKKKSCHQFKLPKSALVNVNKDRLLHHVQLICDQILFSSNNWQVLQGNSLLQSQNVLARNS